MTLDDSVWRASPGERRVKRLLDVAGALALLGATAPLLMGAGAATALRHGGSPIFRQPRAGLRGRVFMIYKLRTMTNERGADGALLTDAERLTPLGRWLRRTSIDELPELINVLRGDMSLVGPRPLLARYLERYTAEQRHRHDAPPGLTGLAQISGRNALTWEEKFSVDLWYVRNWSLRLDLEILLRTAWAVVAGAGVSAIGEATMGEFRGSASADAGTGGSASEPVPGHVGARS